MGEGEGGMFQENSIEACILSRVKQITSPGWMHETSAWTCCTGKTLRDWVEREVGGGLGMGNTCKSMADSFQCMTKPTVKKTNKQTKKKLPAEGWYNSEVSVSQLTGKKQTENHMSTPLEYRNRIYWKSGRFYATLEN